MVESREAVAEVNEGGEEHRVIVIDVPQPHSEGQDEFVRCTHLRQVCKAGRQWGKTEAVAIKALLAFLGVCNACLGEGCGICDNTGRVRQKRVLYAVPTVEQMERFWFIITEALAEAIDAGQLKKNETEHSIEVPGTEIVLKAKTAWNANSLRGGYWDLLILEEYQLMNENVWADVGQPMLLRTNGTAVFIFTPPSLKSEGVSKATDPRHASKLYKKYEHDETGRWKCFHYTSLDNPVLSQVALAELTRSQDMSLDSYRREILAEDDEIEESWIVYGRFNEEVCRIKRFAIPKEWKVISGHDFGTANPAALFVVRVQLPLPEGVPKYIRFGDFIAFREYAPGAGFSTVQHIQKFKELTEGYKVEISLGGNLTTEEEIRTGYAPQGWPISRPLISKVNAQIDRVIGLMELNKFYIFEDLYGLLGEIASCMWEVDSENRTTNKVRNESRYHLLSCLRYLVTYLPVEHPHLTKDNARPKVKIW